MKRKIVVEIDVDGRYCGNCYWFTGYYESSKCEIFDEELDRLYELESSDAIFKRCQKCIDAEIKER